MDIEKLGRDPISPESPAGADVRYEPEMDKLQQEIDKLSIATQAGGGIDWNQVVNLAGEILASKSKNILVAAYLGAGLVATRGLEGLGQGAAVLKDLVEQFWDTLYPPKKRLRGRIAALNWWLEQSEQYLKSYAADAPLPAALISGLMDTISGLDRSVADKTDEAPILSKLNDYLQRFPVEQPEPQAAPEPEPDAQAAPAPSSPQPAAAPKPKPPQPAAPKPAAATPVGDIASVADAERATENALLQLARVGDFLLAADIADAQAYRLNRIAAWLAVDRPPMSDKGKTMLPGPDALIRSGLDGQVAAREYEGAIQNAEGRVREFLFWLDLSRITADCLEALGGKYRIAAEAVVAETLQYTDRVPGLENLTFADGTPFADRETRAWLKRHAKTGDQPAVAGGSGMAAEVAEAAQKARELLRDQKTEEGIRLLEVKLRNTAAGQGRLLVRIALAGLLQDAARPELARPQLEAILTEIDAYHVEEWDPELATVGLSAICAGFTDEEDEDILQQRRKALSRLARISPVAAWKLTRD